MVRLSTVAAALAVMASPLWAQDSNEELKKELQQLRQEVDGLKAQQAGQVQNQTQPIPSMGGGQVDAMGSGDSPVMTLFSQTKLSGFVDTGYELSFNHLSVSGNATNNVGQNPIRVFDDRANSFYLNAIQLNLQRLASQDMIVGYRIELAAGHDPGIYDVGNVALKEGWLEILAPVGDGLDFRMGKLEKLAGYEMIESMYDMNYSRSMLFGTAPFTTTGLRMAYTTGGPTGDGFTGVIGVNNGFNLTNTFADDNHGKGLESAVKLKFSPDFWVQATVLVANEDANLSASASDKTYLADLKGELSLGQLMLGFNFDWNASQGSVPDPLTGAPRRSVLDGGALYGKFLFNDWASEAIRAEYFSDSDGRIAGLGPIVPLTDTGTGSRVIEVTATTEFKVAKQVIVRIEVRHDDSNNHNFNRDGHPARGDNTLGFEAIMPF